MLPWLFVRVWKSVVGVLFFVVVSLLFSGLWIVPVMSEVCKKYARTELMFSSTIVSLTLYPLLSFRQHPLITLAVCCCTANHSA
jgi:hypothetical protein